MNDDEMRDGMESEGISRTWTDRYIRLLTFVRAQRDAAIAAAEGHEHVVVPLAPETVHDVDLEMGHRLHALLENGGAEGEAPQSAGSS